MTDQTETRSPISLAAEQAGERVSERYATNNPEVFPDRNLFELAVQHAALDAATDAKAILAEEFEDRARWADGIDDLAQAAFVWRQAARIAREEQVKR